MPKTITVAIDRYGWCFDNIAKQLVKNLCDEWSFVVAPHLNLTRGESDILLNMWWGSTLRMRTNIKSRVVLTCLYDHLSWQVDDYARHQFSLALRNTDLLIVANEKIGEELKGVYNGGLPPITIGEDGVDTDLFKLFPLPTKFACGWTGNSQRDTPGAEPDLKGLNILKAACKQANVPLKILDTCSGGAWPHDKMPNFYKDISVYLCGSYREGTPNPVLEAMACGRPIISTGVGIVPKVVIEGQTGYIVDRTVGSFAEAINRLATSPQHDLAALGKAASCKVSGEFSWPSRAANWRKIFREAERIIVQKESGAKATIATSTGYPFKTVETTVIATAQDMPSIVSSTSNSASVSTASQQTSKSSVPQEDTKRRIVIPTKQVLAERRYKARLDIGKARVLCISDVCGWAFHQNLRDMAEYLSDEITADHWFVWDYKKAGSPPPDMELYDAVFSPYHRWGIDTLLPKERTVGSLRASWFKPELENDPGQEEFDLVNSYRAFHVVTKMNYDQLRKHCPRVFYLTNPVNTKRFEGKRLHRKEPTFMWNGNAKHANGKGVYVKGFYDIIQPACKETRSDLVFAEYNSAKLKPEEMPDFYRRGDIALCASLYEGASNSVMESMASGAMLITTASGNAKEMQQSQLEKHGRSGIILIERSLEAFIEAIQKAKEMPMSKIAALGKLNRQEIEESWSWNVWKDRYLDFLRMCF